MKPIVLFLVFIGGAGLGVLLHRWSRPAPLPTSGTGEAHVLAVPAPPGTTAAASLSHRSGSTGIAVGKSSPKVKALLAGFNRRNRVESQLAVLRKIMVASAEELAELAKEMTGPSRSDPGWWQTRAAVMQRWVQLAPDEAIAWAKAPQKGGLGSYQAAEVFGMLANIDSTRALTEAQAIANPTLKSRAIQSVVTSISQADPEKAFRLCQTLPSDQRSGIYYTLFNSWAERNPAAAGASLLTLQDRNERSQASSSLMNRWAAQDPAAALAWARGLTDSGMQQTAVQSFFSVFGRRDPAGAMIRISEFPRSQQHPLVSNVVRSWMQTDPDAASAWVLSRPSAFEQQQLLAVAARNLGSMTGDQAAQLVSRLNPGSGREQALKQAVSRWMGADPDAAVAFTKTLSSVEQLRLREQVVQGLASHDPNKALAYLKDHPIDNSASGVWSAIATAIGRTSSAAKALEWANALPEEISRWEALPRVFSQIAWENPAEAARQAAALPDGPARTDCLWSVAGQWAGAGMEEALTWAKGLAGKDREVAMGAVLGQRAPHEPTVAAEQFNELLAGLPTGTKLQEKLVGAVGAIATAYFAENEHAAARWAATLPQDDARAVAVKSLAEQWTQYDPAGASEWIGTLPGGKPRDEAVGQLVRKIASSDPGTAFAWADSVTDSGDRSNLLDTTVASWRKVNAAAAREAIETTDWPEDEKAKWLDKVK